MELLGKAEVQSHLISSGRMYEGLSKNDELLHSFSLGRAFDSGLAFRKIHALLFLNLLFQHRH